MIRLILALLQVMFIGLKLAGIINWSLWLVFSPMLAMLGAILIIIMIGAGYGMYQRRRLRKLIKKFMDEEEK